MTADARNVPHPVAESGPQSVSRGRALPVIAIVVVVAELLLLATSYARVIGSGGEAWQTGDWLINYAGGIVRRGFVGWLIWLPNGSVPVLPLTYVIQIGLLAAFCSIGFVLFWRTSRTAPWFMVALSPAFLLFPFLSPEGGLRKELLALTAIGIMAMAVRFGWPVFAVIPAIALFLLSALAHEAMALTLPGVIALLLLGQRRLGWSRRAVAALLATASIGSLAALAWGILHPADATQVAQICDSWVSGGLDQRLCRGSLDYLDTSALEAIRQTISMYPSYFALVPLMVLSLVPFYALGAPRRVWLLMAAISITLTPLFVVGVDYGRWVFIITSISSLYCLADPFASDFRPRSVPVWMALLFVGLWSIPYTGATTDSSLLMQVAKPTYQLIAERSAELLSGRL
ncbi:MAG: hypothetical protein GC156_11805 [Actinomycetales bacterium]|nr:hypothetical protein [Actinomycetales bacterium]